MVRILALLIMCASAADAFVLAPVRRDTKKIQCTRDRTVVRTATSINQNAVLHAQPATAFSKAMTAVTGSCLWERMDTLSAAGLCDTQHNNDDSIRKKKMAALRSIGYFGYLGQLGVYISSAVLVTALKKTIFPPSTDEEQQAPGIMNRCPWPFVFFHDPIQGLKDSPTWIAVVWFAIWRAFRMTAKCA